VDRIDDLGREGRQQGVDVVDGLAALGSFLRNHA
jgi:hypothetical protein